MLLTRHESRLEKAIHVSERNPDVLLEWMEHPEYAEIARLYYAARCMTSGMGRLAQRQLEVVLGMQPEVATDEFCRHHPIAVSIDIMGISVHVNVERESVPMLLAGTYLAHRDWPRLEMLLPTLDDLRTRTALAAVSAFEQGKYEDVVDVTQCVSPKSCVALDGVSLVLRACAFREWGDVIAAESTMHDAYLAAWVHRDTSLYDIYERELGRTLAIKHQLYGLSRNVWDADED